MSKLEENESFIVSSNAITKNVFVTQINEREDENSDGVVKHAIVKESPSKLLKTGLNTYQNTLVIKKEDELSLIDSDLYNKRNEYERKMAKFNLKKQELLAKQQLFLDQTKSFESFITENDSKRRRALIKYQNEVRLIDFQRKSIQSLEMEINKTKELHEKLLKKVHYNKRYEEFLLKVIDFLPPDYIKVSENILGGLIMRYNTLFSTNELLLVDMSAKSEENQNYLKMIRELKEDHARQLLQNNYRLSKMYEEYETLKDQLQRGEQQFKIKHGDIRSEILNFSLILRSIDNITKKCASKFEESISDTAIEDKLEKIKNYIKTSVEIIEMVNHTKDKPTNNPPPIQPKSILNSQIKMDRTKSKDKLR